LLERLDADDSILVITRRWITVEWSTIEQVAGVPKVEAAFVEGPKPLRLIPLKIRR
jgi:hypothetical protein